MLRTRRQFIIILTLVLAGFGIGIYLQHLKHEESTRAAWTANRYNLERFYKVREYMDNLDESNWQVMRESIGQELDSFMILRFRKEMDSLNTLKAGQ